MLAACKHAPIVACKVECGRCDCFAQEQRQCVVSCAACAAGTAAGAASAAPGGELQDWGHLYSLHATELQQHHYLQAAAAGNGQSPGGGSGQTVAPLEVSPAATAAPLLQLAIAQLG